MRSSEKQLVRRLLPGKERWDKFLFDMALAELGEEPRVIVEIGAIRDKKAAAQRADGWSTLKWYGTQHTVYTVDNDSRAIATTRWLLGDDTKNIQLRTMDAVSFLSFFGTIDLLYLDGPDPTPQGQQLCFQCLKAAEMAPRSLILFDDCDFSDGGKAKLALPYALTQGYEMIADNVRQKLLKRE